MIDVHEDGNSGDRRLVGGWGENMCSVLKCCFGGPENPQKGPGWLDKGIRGQRRARDFNLGVLVIW